MPVLLASESAPSLLELLTQLEQNSGLDWVLPDGTERSAYEQIQIRGIGSLQNAGETELSFLANPKLRAQLNDTRAAAVFMRADDLSALNQAEASYTFLPIICDSPYFAYALIAQWFESLRVKQLPKAHHPSAVIHPSATIAEGVHIGPHAVIEANVHIGRGTRVEGNAYVGNGVSIGSDCHIHPNVVLYHGTEIGDRCIIHGGAVLGADGFGFAPHPQQEGQWAKIAQLGKVVIGNDVEIGANTTIDRGALDATQIGDGVKLDNQIMVAHNVIIGPHTAIAACVGIAGSTHIGARCIIGGAAMISGHLTITDDVQVSGGTAITSSVHQSGRLTGVYPYQEHRQWQRNAAVISQLSSLRKRVRDLERALQASATETEK
ncbi:MAG TPA: UDP-3-O-(3-hydroxymyristoyl)glucosamine N-acyltransferase [Paenalcaligenes sp.]|nr:UDP-3-O-(3-hydroxymyristoyl)glucosamine N-acyltransferase [Paenalcaligenes sp.]